MRIALAAAALVALSFPSMAGGEDIPSSFQGRWRGASCLVDIGVAYAPPEIVDRLKLRIRQSVLSVTSTSFTRTPSTVARMSEGTGIKASATREPLSVLLFDLNIWTPMVLGEPIIFNQSTVLKGVSLTIKACQVGPLALVVRPGQPRPSGAPIPMQVCKPNFMFHYPDADHLAMPSDGLLGCLEIFERIPPYSKSL